MTGLQIYTLLKFIAAAIGLIIFFNTSNKLIKEDLLALKQKRENEEKAKAANSKEVSHATTS